MKSQVVKAGLLLLLSAMIVRGEETIAQYTEDPLLTAKRVIGGQVFYINRQTNLWHFITAKYLRPHVFSGGWMVTGKVDGGTNFTFILKNPPAEALARFSRLKARYQSLKPDFADLVAEADAVKNALDEVRLEIDRLRANPGPQIGSQYDRDRLTAINEALAQERLLSDRNVNLSDSVGSMKAEIDGLKASGMDLDGDFIFSCYAVLLNQIMDKMFVYDHGRIMQ